MPMYWRASQRRVVAVCDCTQATHPGGLERRRGRQQHRQGIDGAALPGGCPGCSGRGGKAMQQPAEHEVNSLAGLQRMCVTCKSNI